MANTPVLLSKEQLIGLIVDSILSRIDDLDDLNVGSDLTQIAEAVGQVIYKPYADQIAMISALSVDRAVGEALQRLAKDNNVPILPALPASGAVDITDLTFQKVQTSIYAGQPAPVAGSLTIYVSDASQFLPTGTIYIGRGTPNVEGPLSYTSIMPLAGGTYYALTLNAGTPTAKFHNIGETVIMGQGGNRSVAAGTVVSTPQGSAIASVSYFTTVAGTILDGETTVQSVPVVSQQVGTVGNVPRGAIQQVSGLSFNATCFNQQPFSNGRPADSEDDIRQRIKEYEQLKAKGTGAALKAASIDVVAPDELKRTTSASVVEGANTSAAVVFDDGTGYEPLFAGIGVETVVDEALGGERDLQLRNVPTAQARIQSGAEYPYAIMDLDNLSVTISGVTTVHQFRSTDFRVAGAATAFEVAASINKDASINFLANTSQGGKRVVIFPRDPKVNNLVVNSLASSDANEALEFFASNVEYTVRLYKNDSLLYQDGLLARLSTKAKPSWSASIIDGDTLTYEVDNTPEVTATFTLTDFQAVNASSTVSASEPIGIWAQVLNNLMPGVEASVDGDVIHLDSNRGFSSSARLRITGGTLRDKIFDLGVSLDSSGRSSDYTFNRNTSQIGLTAALQAGDSISSGSAFTRAKLITASLPSGPSVAGNVWFVVDGDAQMITNSMRSTTQLRFVRTGVVNTSLVRSGNVVTVTTATPHGYSPNDVIVVDGVTPASFNGTFTLLTASGTTYTYSQIDVNASATIFGTTSTGATTLEGRNSATLLPEGFDLVQPGDWLLLWVNPGDNVNFEANAGFWRVQSVQGVGSVTVSNDSGVNTTWLSSIPISRVVFVRSTAPMQKLSYPASSLVALAENIASQLVGVNTDIIGSKIRISTKTFDLSGQLIAVAADTNGQALGLTIGVAANNTTSHVGFNTTDDLDYGIPSFTHIKVGSVGPNAVGGIDYLDLGGTLADYLEFLDNYSTSLLQVLPDSAARRRIFVRNFNMMTGTLTTVAPAYLEIEPSLIQKNDRFFIRSSYQLDSDDKLVVVLDNDTEIKTYKLDVSRKLQVNGGSLPTLTTFSADDKQSGLSLDDPSSFSGFDFSDFKVWRQAGAALTDGIYNILARFPDFGPAGNLSRVGIVYPNTITNTALTHKVSTSDVIDIGIVIPVTTARTPSWDGTSAFTAAVTTVNGRDQVVYTWRVGTQPDFTIGGSNLSIGDLAIIGTASDFLSANRGVSAKVTNFTGTTFTIDRPTGNATNDAPVFSSIQNINGIVTCVVTSGHNIENGDRIGIYDTAQSTPSVYPLSDTYIPVVINPTTFTVQAPAGTPGGAITSATHVSNVVTVNAPSHGLSVGNFILVSGASISNYNGTFRVFAVPSVNQFQYIVAGSSASIANDGRFDFQSYLASGSSVSISTISRTGATVTVNTSSPHGFSSSQIVEITGVVIDPWSNATNYGLGDVVVDPFDSLLYKSLSAGNLNNDPHLSPAFWQVTTFDLTGAFTITVTTPTQFTYAYQDITGDSSGTGGSATLFGQAGKLARCIGAATANLAFGEISTTAQAIIDYATNSMAGLINLSNNGGSLAATIDTSTEDLDISTDYLYGNVSDIRAINGSRAVDITVDSQVDPGATILVSVTNTDYNGEYVVITSTQSGANWILRCYSSVYSFVTGSVTGGTGTYTGSYPYKMFADGENSVLLQNLSTPPNFTMKRAWTTAPAIGEEVRLLAANKDHLTRFWNKLIVSGITNVASVENTKFGEEIEISTDTFGSNGSVEVASSLANNGQVALATTGSEIDNKLGAFGIPYELRKGLTYYSWIRLTQTVAQAKSIGFGIATQVKVLASGLELPNTLNGTFQTSRASDHDYSTVFRVERHGKFTAFIAVDGSIPNLGTNGINEGDWVRVRNVLPQLYDTAKTYLQGQKSRLSNGNTYVAVQNVPLSTSPPNLTYWAQYSDYSDSETYSSNTSLGRRFAMFGGRLWEVIEATPFTNTQPGSDNDKWRQREWNVANEGIYQIVRTFGEDSFWIEGQLSEELTQLLDPSGISFYSYDSIMPGDILNISGPILGLANIGTYEVLDDAADGTALFPTSTRIYTNPIPLDSGITYILLGSSFGQVSIIENEPIVLYKRISSIGPGIDGIATVIVDTPNLVNKISNSLSAYLTMENKLGYSTDARYGIDGYKYYNGLLKQLNRVIYGDPASIIDYPGIRAAGTDVDIKPALIRRVQLSIAIRIRIGLSYTEIQDRVKAAISGYVNQLGVGESVALSQVVAAANSVNGVMAVSVISPTYTSSSDLIEVGADQTAKIVNPQEDILVSIVGA